MLPPQRRVRNQASMTLPGLHLDDWRATKDTLHLYSQILGKIRLATTAPRNHWWNAALYVDVRGLTTRRLHHPRYDVRAHDRPHRPRPDRLHRQRSHQVIRHRRRNAGRGLRCSHPRNTQRTGRRPQYQRGTVRRPDASAAEQNRPDAKSPRDDWSVRAVLRPCGRCEAAAVPRSLRLHDRFGRDVVG